MSLKLRFRYSFKFRLYQLKIFDGHCLSYPSILSISLSSVRDRNLYHEKNSNSTAPTFDLITQQPYILPKFWLDQTMILEAGRHLGWAANFFIWSWALIGFMAQNLRYKPAGRHYT